MLSGAASAAQPCKQLGYLFVCGTALPLTCRRYGSGCYAAPSALSAGLRQYVADTWVTSTIRRVGYRIIFIRRRLPSVVLYRHIYKARAALIGITVCILTPRRHPVLFVILPRGVMPAVLQHIRWRYTITQPIP